MAQHLPSRLVNLRGFCILARRDRKPKVAAAVEKLLPVRSCALDGEVRRA